MRSLPVCDFSDQSRLICSCPDHKTWRLEFDFDELTEAEHEFLGSEDYLSWVQGQHRGQRPSKVTALPTYESSTWVSPTKPKGGAAKGPECEVCHDRPRGDSFVCAVCLSEVEAMFANIPMLMAELTIKAERQDRTHSANQVMTNDSRTPWDKKLEKVALEDGQWVSVPEMTVITPDQVTKITPINSTAKASARVLAEAGYDQRGYSIGAERCRQALDDVVCQMALVVSDHGKDVLEGAVWLSGHLSSLAVHPTAVKLVIALRRAYSRAMGMIDNVATGTYLGVCSADLGEGKMCQSALYAPLPRQADDEQQVTCPRTSCGRTYVILELWKAKNQAIDDMLMSVTELVDLSFQDPKAFGKKLTEPTIRNWIKQGRLVRAGSRPNPCKTETCLYRVRVAKELALSRRNVLAA